MRTPSIGMPSLFLQGSFQPSVQTSAVVRAETTATVDDEVVVNADEVDVPEPAEVEVEVEVAEAEADEPLEDAEEVAAGAAK